MRSNCSGDCGGGENVGARFGGKTVLHLHNVCSNAEPEFWNVILMKVCHHWQSVRHKHNKNSTSATTTTDTSTTFYSKRELINDATIAFTWVNGISPA